MELTPRTLDDDDVTVEEGEVGPPRRTRSRRRRSRWLPLAVLAVVVVGIGALAYRGLNDASLYFRNADEAVAMRDELGTDRFRLQGTVVGEPQVDGDDVTFDVSYDDVTVAVAHTGTPPDMFEPGIPVVLEGSWSETTDVFESDTMLIKHDAEYESQDDYDERIRQADEGAGGATTDEPGDEPDGAPAGGAG